MKRYITILLVSAVILLGIIIHDYGRVHVLNLIRTLVHIYVPQSTISISVKSRIWKISTKEIFDIYKKQIGGVDCRGISYSLLKVYTDLGFEAYSYSAGIGDFTHVIVLVNTEYKGKKILLVEDPFFNVTYTTPKGDPLDFIEMLKLIKQKKYGEIVISGGHEKHLYLCSKDDIAKSICFPNNDHHILEFHHGDIFGYKEKPTIETLKEQFHIYLEMTNLLSGDKDKYPVYKVINRIRNAIISK